MTADYNALNTWSSHIGVHHDQIDIQWPSDSEPDVVGELDDDASKQMTEPSVWNGH